MNIKIKERSKHLITFEGCKTALVVYGKIVIICSVIAGILQFASVTISFKVLLLGFIVLGLYFLVLLFVFSKVSYLPNIFSTEDTTDGLYKANFSTSEKLAEACILTKPYYGNEFVPPNIAELWRLKNKKAFVDIENKDGILIASFGIILPSEGLFDAFIRGKTADTLWRNEDICTFNKSKNSSRLYISGVVVREPHKTVGKIRARVMVWAMLQYYKKYYGLQKERDLYATAVNKESNQILTNMGFKLITYGKDRLDTCDLFCLHLDKMQWGKIAMRVGDFSESCKLNI